MFSDIAIKIDNISKIYQIYSHPRDRLKQFILPKFYSFFGKPKRKYFQEFRALDNVTLEIKKGQTFGIIGRNGSGKSTLLQLICGTLNQTSGTVKTSGRIAALLELGAGFNHDFSGKENVYLNASLLGLSQKEIEDRYEAIVEFADVWEAIDQPVKTYSSGMVVRLAFSVAVHTDPDVLIVDEALAVGDMIFQARCLDHIKGMKDKGVTTLFVTHDIGTFQTICDSGALLDDGVLLSVGKPELLAAQYYNLSQEKERRRIEKGLKKPVESSLKEAKEKIANNGAEGIEYRFGSGKAIIASYHILNSNGEETKNLEIGSKFRVVIDVNVIDDLEDLTAAVMFRNPQGQNLFGANTRYDSTIRMVELAGGQNIRVTIDMVMRLNPGQYLLHLGLANCMSDHSYVTLDNRDGVDVVSVFGKSLSFGIIHHEPEIKIDLIK